MITRENKEQTLEGLSNKLESSKAVFLTNLIGIPSNDAVQIRKELREVNGSLTVARNTLLKKASEGTELFETLNEKKGPTAMAFANEDVPAVAKVLYEASKKYESVVLFKGLFDGKTLTADEIEALAKLPSREQMLATLLATFNAPVSAFVRVMEEIRKSKENNGE